MNMDLALHNLQRLICLKAQTKTKNKQTNKQKNNLEYAEKNI